MQECIRVLRRAWRFKRAVWEADPQRGAGAKVSNRQVTGQQKRIIRPWRQDCEIWRRGESGFAIGALVGFVG
jgi:hypothetical protein